MSSEPRKITSNHVRAELKSLATNPEQTEQERKDHLLIESTIEFLKEELRRERES